MQVRGSFPANIDNVDKQVVGLVGTTLKEHPKIYSKYFNIESSDRKFERIVTKASFTEVPLKGEGEDYQTQLINQGYTKDFTHLEFGLAFGLTQTAQEDDTFGVYKDYAVGMARAARVTEETYAARLMNLAFSGGTENTPDGVIGFSASHLLITGGGTFSNLVSADLSRTALETALTLFNTDHKSDEGHFMQPKDGYILEVPPALQFLADRIVNSTGLPGSADNDRNPIKANYSIDVVVNPYFSDADSWRVLAKNKMHGLKSYTRVAIGMEPPVTEPRSGNRLYKLRFRRSWGFTQWQGMVGSPGA